MQCRVSCGVLVRAGVFLAVVIEDAMIPNVEAVLEKEWNVGWHEVGYEYQAEWLRVGFQQGGESE